MEYERNEFKVSFDKEGTQFFVNEKKRTIVCKLTGHLSGPETTYYVKNTPSFRSESFTAIGKAKCSENDVFDVNRGKRIALAKAENKVYLQATRYLDDVMDVHGMFLRAIDDFIDKAYRCCGHNEDYIEQLSYPAHPNYITKVGKDDK